MYVSDANGHRQLQSLTAYARTNEKGTYEFKSLPEDKAYEVFPLQPGFQFGLSKGVQRLDRNETLNFIREPHKIRLFSTQDFNNLKKEKALIVRLPKDFNKWFWIIAIGFLLSFWVVHLLLSSKFSSADNLMLPLVMLLTGFSFLTLLSLQDPLRDRFLAQSMLGYFMAGMVGLCLLMLFNLKKFTVDSGVYRMFMKESKGTAQGFAWAGAAMLLLLLTILFGTGPEGSGVKVNLLGFQPSEMVKFSIIFFLAGFFSTNEKFISEYRSWQKRWSFFSFALAAIVATIFLFLMLGDLGPAIVTCFAFIILFSFSRGDFLSMAGAVLFYVLLVWIVKNIWIATGITALVLALIFLFIQKKISESAIMAIVVIAGFLLLDQVPFLDELFPGPIQRLIDRKAIWLDPWNNEVFGGDHVANGIWAMASGGMSGQGIGEGFAKTIPEAHTDMILPSLSEDFGWAGVFSVFIIFLIYLHRAILIGRQTGTPFLFYICAGIGVATFVQFILIAGGSIGALPLSGVSLPFVSYGGSSLILNLLASGFLLSSSVLKGSPVQMKYIERQQDKNLLPALLAALVSIILLTVTASRYLLNNKQWIVQPALVADRSGLRIFSYNPRINILMNRLQAGNLYDRNHLLLATSSADSLQKKKDSLSMAGLPKYKLDALAHKRLDRFYPFSEQMFFWTGDLNTGIFLGSTNGYYGEYRHLAQLRGFQTPAVPFTVMANRYREDRFLPRTVREMTVTKNDYSALAPMLLAGINSAMVDSFKLQNRDVRLSMDAHLQTAIQQSFQSDDSLSDNRVSVVIMEALTGDVLASALYPLPTVSEPEKLMLTTREQNQLGYWITNTDLGFTYATQPGSTAKIATALAAFNKLGTGAANKTFLIREGDLIRVRSDEPDETGNIDMRRAFVKSNNPYFIKLANEENLQEEMVTIYMQVGMFLKGKGGYYYTGEKDNVFQQEEWRKFWRNTEFKSKAAYNKNDIRATRGRGISGMAWGQGELVATPASVARMASGIANNGVLMPNRYVLQISDSLIAVGNGEHLAKDSMSAKILTSFMLEQSANKVSRLGVKVAGKTGTPERIVKKKRINDGWYTFFVPKADGQGYIAVCVRMEDARGSSEAVWVAGKHVIPQLLKQGYIKGF